jgi:hypothetical protein
MSHRAIIYLDRSMACAESHDTVDTARSVEVNVDLPDGPWVGFLYNGLRTQDGDDVGLYHATCGCWMYEKQMYSDITICIEEVPT